MYICENCKLRIQRKMKYCELSFLCFKCNLICIIFFHYVIYAKGFGFQLKLCLSKCCLCCTFIMNYWHPLVYKNSTWWPHGHISTRHYEGMYVEFKFKFKIVFDFLCFNLGNSDNESEGECVSIRGEKQPLRS